jgi:hypothetical protein
MIQVGLDMAPTPTQIATWKSDCADYNRTKTAWDAMQQTITNFNASLASNHLEAIKLVPSKLTAASCSFSPEQVRKATR